MSAGTPPELSAQHEGHEGDNLQKLLDRKQLQIEVGNAVVSKLTLKDLLVTISAFLKEFIHHDVASVVLYKPPPLGVLSVWAVCAKEFHSGCNRSLI